MKIGFDRLLSVLLTGATVISCVVLLRRESQAPPVDQTHAGPPRYVERWRDAIPVGLSLGNAEAPLQLVEFTDFECPFCRRFHEEVVPKLFTAFPDSVDLVLVHFPLPMHRFSDAAARAAECGGADGSSPRALIDELYAKQDSFGLKTWTSFAAEAGVADSSAFSRCISSPTTFPRIAAGKRFAASFGVHGTPGVMLNGWLFDAPPSDSSLIATARLLLAGGNQLPRVMAPHRR
jgi:protein-disulfide isomerase